MQKQNQRLFRGINYNKQVQQNNLLSHGAQGWQEFIGYKKFGFFGSQQLILTSMLHSIFSTHCATC